ncbi:DUF998 domain-containing protein [Nonomuraea sp. NPDC050691]|uniref:DUF998 domain-containing protein n=1 Tax=Nonomuraea sp. NPDC050691 TaxID=3155661 RepID=UPI0033E87153
MTTTSDTAAHRRDTGVSLLLGCGTVAGLLFPVASFAQAFTRTGFDLRRHAFSALTLGDLGWLQTATFALTGLLACAFALGVRRTARPGVAGPILIGVYGVAMVGGGICTPDPALGWPAGAPAGLPEHLSIGSALHTVFGAAAFLSLIVAGLVFARRFAGRGWTACSVIGSLATAALTVPPWSEDSASLRFAAGAVLISGWLAALSLRLRNR